MAQTALHLEPPTMENIERKLQILNWKEDYIYYIYAKIADMKIGMHVCLEGVNLGSYVCL